MHNFFFIFVEVYVHNTFAFSSSCGREVVIVHVFGLGFGPKDLVVETVEVAWVAAQAVEAAVMVALVVAWVAVAAALAASQLGCSARISRGIHTFTFQTISQMSISPLTSKLIDWLSTL